MLLKYGLLLNTLRQGKLIKYTYALFQPRQRRISCEDESYRYGSSLPSSVINVFPLSSPSHLMEGGTAVDAF